MIKKLKIILFLVFFIYQTPSFSKTTDERDFNPKYLSNYLSALISQNSDDSVKYFNSSKILINAHVTFLEKYIKTLTVNGQIKKSINIVKQNRGKENSKFFEAELLLLIDNFKKKNFNQNIKLLDEFQKYRDYGNFNYIIYEVLKSYNDLFLKKELNPNNKDFGKLSLINEVFQYCYLDNAGTNSKFISLINSEDGNYKRYLFFYLANIVENKDYNAAREISSTIEPLSSSLLISQTKNWIENEDFKKFNNYFSCKNESDILSEFLFLLSSLYSSKEEIEKSNFYLNISIFLNTKFKYNLSLLAENYYLNNNFDLAKKTLSKFDDQDRIYYWYKIKKTAQILKKQKKEEASLKFIETEFRSIKKPSIKILYDMANIYKNFKKYEKAIKYYSKILLMLEDDTPIYADVLYKRGGSYERLNQFNKADTDLLRSLDITPGDPYTMNYLAYSWLERDIKIDEAIQMLENAYNKKENDPYITDSIGWGYYLVGDYIKAEKYLKRAVELMPFDPIIHDHYGDVLWRLNRKIQAKYFWESVLDLEDTEEKMKKDIYFKLLNGLKKI